jgi:ABC-type multidrug transport system ATPase subunit
MARQFVYFMQGLTKAYPTRKVLDNVHLSFYPDAKIGVLGVNGSGKSTLLKIMAGLDKDYNGEAWVAEGARVGYLEQEPQLDASLTVRENVMLGVAKQKAILDRYNELAMNYSDETADEMTKLQDEIEAAGLWDLDSKVDQAMDALRCPPDDADISKLSGGEKRRVALCKLLLDQPDLLLLDEPTNHLDAESVSWLEGHLRNYPGAILIVTHGLCRSRSVWRRKAARMPRTRRRWSASRSGSPRRRKRGRPNPRRGISAMRICSSRPARSKRKRRRSPFRSPNVSATTWWTSRASRRDSAIAS